ncbi:hypothetical protein Tco_0412422 [Tanacetum coccineum]
MRKTIDSLLSKTINELTNQSSDSETFGPRERIKELELRTQRRNNFEEELFKDMFHTEEELAYHKELLVDFMILEDLGSVIDGKLSEVVLGKPFVQASKLTYDESLGLIRFAHRDDEVVFRMPQRTKKLDLVSPLEKDKFEAFFVENIKIRKKGFKHVLEKRKGYYKSCMNLGPGSRDSSTNASWERYAQLLSRSYDTFIKDQMVMPTEGAILKAQEMWEAIERLQQGESLNIQDVKTNLFWEFGQFTSHDGETIESYYTRFYKMMNEMIRNNLTVATMQVNVQFLQQLQPEWSRFVTIVKQQHKLDEVSYHKLFDILKQYQKEVNELRAERMAKNANPLALVATAQTLQDPYYQSSKSHKSYAPTSKASLPTRSHATTRYKGKEIAKPITPPSESASEEDMETGDSNVIPDSPNMCDNDIQDDQNDVECDDERVALANLIANLKLNVDENKKNCQKQLKKVNATLTQDLTECKSILAETSRTLGESNSIRDSCLVALQNKQTEFERYKAFNDRIVDYDKLERKLNETLGLLAQKEIDIKEGLKVKAYEISVVKEKHDELVKQSLLTKSHYEGLVKEKTKVITDLKLKEEKDIDKMISMENQLKFLNEIVYKRSQSIQTIHMLAPKCPTFNGRPTFANPMYLKKAQYEKPCLYAIPHDQSDPANRLIPDREEILTLEEESRSKLNKDLVKPFDF